MASITIRDRGDETKRRLRIRAAHHARSMEVEARDILRDALSAEPAGGPDLAAAIRARFAPLDGADLELAHCDPAREPPNLG